MVVPIPLAMTVAPLSALEAVYRAELKAVYAFLWRLGARESDMEDLAHDVFATAAKKWSSYDAAKPARPWLLGIAFRVFSDSRRRVPHVTGTDAPEQASAQDEPGPDDAVALRQARALLQRALATLPDERRDAFALHELEGLSVAEVAEATGAPVPTVYSRLKQARVEVSDALKRFALEEARRGGLS